MNKFYDLLNKNIVNRINMSPMSNISIDMESNTKTKYNASGNIHIRANLTNNFPNYAEALINRGMTTNDSISTMLSFISNDGFIASCPQINNIDLTKEINKQPWHMWNLMYNRSYNIEDATKISCVFMSKFNKLIDYVISSDLQKPDETFRKLVTRLFTTDNGKQMYSYAHNTLVLPSLVNHLAIRNNKLEEHALRYVGFIKKDTLLLPKTTNKFSDEEKWHLKGLSLPCTTICPYLFKYKDVNKFEIGKYNYPLCEKMQKQWTPSTINVNETFDKDLCKNINIKNNIINTDVNLDVPYMTTIFGTDKYPLPEIGGRLLHSNEFVASDKIALPICWSMAEQGGGRECGSYACKK